VPEIESDLVTTVGIASDRGWVNRGRRQVFEVNAMTLVIIPLRQDFAAAKIVYGITYRGRQLNLSWTEKSVH
jgi:hypothetical protein